MDLSRDNEQLGRRALRMDKSLRKAPTCSKVDRAIEAYVKYEDSLGEYVSCLSSYGKENPATLKLMS